MFFGLLPDKEDRNEEGSFELSFAGLFKLMCCVKDRPNEDRLHLARMADTLERVCRKIDSMERC